MFRPTHLSLFAIAKGDGHPIAGAPFYAEVVAPMVVAQPPLDQTVATQGKGTTVETAYPLGILATDHVGYLSFDLTRLPANVYDALLKAVGVRRGDMNDALDVSVWFYALGKESLRFDALMQGRFSEDAILTKLEFDVLDLPLIAKAVGYQSMQNPTLTDWRMSSASFATNPSALLGDDEGCENLLPAHVALQEYKFYQVVQLNDADTGLPAQLQESVRLGIVHEFRVGWYPLGHSLGQILYSLPLAPGESVNLAVVDWTRRDDAQRKEQTTLDEQLVHDEHRDRGISETVNAAVNEYQHGSSFMGGIAGSAGASGSIGLVGVAAGIAGSLGGSTASSNGSRSIAASTVQNLSDNITQASSAMRELQSTVVVHSTQSEKEAIESRTVVNYNHSHALTILYYEVLRHFRVVTEFVRRRPAVLVKLRNDWFTGANAVTNVRENRAALQPALLDSTLAGAFDALDRIHHRAELASIVPPLPPPNPGDRQFSFFTIRMKTGGLVHPFESAGTDQPVIRATLIGPTSPVNLVDTRNNTSINPFRSFTQGNVFNTFVATVNQPVRWSDIVAVSLSFELHGPADMPLSFAHIQILAQGIDGDPAVTLVDRVYEGADEGNLVIGLMEPQAPEILLPAARPPWAAPFPSPPSPDEIEDGIQNARLLAHLDYHNAYYSRAIVFSQSPPDRAIQLSAIMLSGETSVLDKLENRPLEVVGEYAAYPCTDPIWSDTIERLIASNNDTVQEPTDERLVTLPTRGVFADAKLGHCNASEEIDNTRFWDWQTSPIPHFAPEIAPTQPVTPQPQQQNLTPTSFPTSLINIVNPPSAPDPTGLAAALTAISTPNIFRDMSGQTQVADLLKKLSDNTISIAQAANQARQIQTKYGDNLQGLGGSGSGGLAVGGQPTGRALATQPSSANRDLQDLGNVLRAGVNQGLLAPGDAPALYKSAAQSATSGMFSNLQDAVTPASSLSFDYLSALRSHIIDWTVANADGSVTKPEWHAGQIHYSSYLAGQNLDAWAAVKCQIHRIVFTVAGKSLANIGAPLAHFESLFQPTAAPFLECEKVSGVGGVLNVGDVFRFRVPLPTVIKSILAALSFSITDIVKRRFDVRVAAIDARADAIGLTAQTLFDHPYAGRRAWRVSPSTNADEYVLETVETNTFPWLPDYWVETTSNGADARLLWETFLQRYVALVGGTIVDQSMVKGKTIMGKLADVKADIDAQRVFTEYPTLAVERDGISPIIVTGI